MNSFDVLNELYNERHNDMLREAEQRRLVRQAKANRPVSNSNWFTRLFARKARPVTTPIQSPHKTVELPVLSTQEIRIWEQQLALYERIAHGNAMADAEAVSDHLRHSQQPC